MHEGRRMIVIDETSPHYRKIGTVRLDGVGIGGRETDPTLPLWWIEFRSWEPAVHFRRDQLEWVKVVKVDGLVKIRRDDYGYVSDVLVDGHSLLTYAELDDGDEVHITFEIPPRNKMHDKET